LRFCFWLLAAFIMCDYLLFWTLGVFVLIQAGEFVENVLLLQFQSKIIV